MRLSEENLAMLWNLDLHLFQFGSGSSFLSQCGSGSRVPNQSAPQIPIFCLTEKLESLCEQSGVDWADRDVRHLPGEHRHQQAAHAPRRPDDRSEREARGQPALQADAGQRSLLRILNRFS